MLITHKGQSARDTIAGMLKYQRVRIIFDYGDNPGFEIQGDVIPGTFTLTQKLVYSVIQ
jgi:hypothetical protein